MDYFKLTRDFWDFAFENPEKIKPNHCALFCFVVEHCNRLGWKEKFGLPTTMAKDAIGIRSYTTYISTLCDLVDFGFIKMIEKSKNQYSSNIIALPNYDKALVKALDKAFVKHVSKQQQSTCESIDSIDKPIYNNTNIQIHSESCFSFEEFWLLYPKKVAKDKCKGKYEKLAITDKQNIKKTLSDFVEYKPFKEYTHPNPLTYLNQKRWEDEIIITSNTLSNGKSKITDHPQFKELAQAIRQDGVRR